jgi:hypothetical protein
LSADHVWVCQLCTFVVSFHPNLESEAVVSKMKPGQVMDDINKNGPEVMNKAFEFIARPSGSSRRNFMAAAGATSLGLLLAKGAEAATVGPLSPSSRRMKAKNLRIDQAQNNSNLGDFTQPTNGDEEALANKIGNYSKGLPHNSDGSVVLSAYTALVNALTTGVNADFEAIPLGGTRKLTNPQSGIAFEMEGGDGVSFPKYQRIPPPTFSSREVAAEIAENYWMALLRDVPFSQYATNATAIAAANDLTSYGLDGKFPKSNGQVTPDLLFRGFGVGEQVGPWLSQFRFLPCPFGVNTIDQRMLHPTAGRNFGNVSFADWLSIQNGVNPSSTLAFETTPKFMRNGRGIGEWVHVDVLFQAYFMAFLIMDSLGIPLDSSNPYTNSRTQVGFGTFGGPHIATVLCEVSTRALHATWWQKWFAHRRLRPEAFAGAIEARLHRGANFPINQAILDDLNTSSRLGGFLNGSALLPLAFAEGSPTHPSYTAGHATVAGACVTILKAFYTTNIPFPNPMMPSDDGLSLVAYTGPTLTVEGELNKLASNIANARNIAGVHWRSDSTNSLLLGEEIAVQLLKEHNTLFNEIGATGTGKKITGFGGGTIAV